MGGEMTKGTTEPTFWEWFKGEYEKRWETTREAGTDIHVSHTTIADWLNGARPPNRYNILKLASYFGLPASEIRSMLDRQKAVESGTQATERTAEVDRLVRLIQVEAPGLSSEEQARYVLELLRLFKRSGGKGGHSEGSRAQNPGNDSTAAQRKTTQITSLPIWPSGPQGDDAKGDA